MLPRPDQTRPEFLVRLLVVSVVTSKTNLQTAPGQFLALEHQMLDENQVHRLAGAAHALRPDWPLKSLVTFINGNLKARTYRDIAIALSYIACEPNTATPKRLLEAGPWWKATNTSDTTYRPPRRNEDCPKHPGNYADACRGCGADKLAADDTQPGDPKRAAAEAARKAAREALEQAKSALCSHGLPLTNCRDHDEPKSKPQPRELTA